MTTKTVLLERHNILSALQTLKSAFAKADLTGVKLSAEAGDVHLEVPFAKPSKFQFLASQESLSWVTPSGRIQIVPVGFHLQQEILGRVVSFVFRAAPPKTGNIRDIFLQRSLRAIQELQFLDEGKLAEAVQAPSDYSVLLTALSTDDALATIRRHDPLAGARFRGIEAKRRLLESSGTALSTSEVAAVLRITRQAVDKRRRERKLLAVELGKKGFRYPDWQLGLPHLEPILRALGDREPWECLSFFLNPSPLLKDRSPLQVLQSKKPSLDHLLRAAASYGEHGA